MKKTKLTLVVTIVMAVAGFNIFGQENKKAKEARKDVKEANTDLKEAKIDSTADYQKFKKDAEIKIADNQKKIAELKAKKSSENKEVKEKYDAKVVALEQKNNELKNRIEGCKNSNDKTAWESFKIKFNKDMNELGTSIKNI